MKKTMIMMLLVLFVLPLGACMKGADKNLSEYRAKIIKISGEQKKDAESGRVYPVQVIEVEISEGIYQGQIFKTERFLDIKNYKNFDMYGVGDRLYVEITTDESGENPFVSINTLIRTPYILILSLLFLSTIVIIAGIKGLKTITALVLTVGCVMFILVPMISKGYHPIISALMSGVIITIVTLGLVGGLNKKTLAAILGTLLGLGCAVILTLTTSTFMRVTGISTEAVGMIMISDIDYALDIKGIFTAGIIIGCLGAVMDVGMSIASSIAEIKKVSENISKKALFYSGMRVGRDIMGTMANTLILAYTGGTIMQMVVWKIYGISFLDMLNKEYIVAEVVKALCGSFGMLLTIPITCVIASRIVSIDLSGFEEIKDN